MASMMALPHEGHLNAVFKMFSFLKIKCNVVAVFDHADHDVEKTQFPTED